MSGAGGDSKQRPRPFACALCNCGFNSQTVYKEHMLGKNHARKLQLIARNQEKQLANPDSKAGLSPARTQRKPKKPISDTRSAKARVTDYIQRAFAFLVEETVEMVMLHVWGEAKTSTPRITEEQYLNSLLTHFGRFLVLVHEQRRDLLMDIVDGTKPMPSKPIYRRLLTEVLMWVLHHYLPEHFTHQEALTMSVDLVLHHEDEALRVIFERNYGQWLAELNEAARDTALIDTAIAANEHDQHINHRPRSRSFDNNSADTYAAHLCPRKFVRWSSELQQSIERARSNKPLIQPGSLLPFGRLPATTSSTSPQPAADPIDAGVDDMDPHP